MTTWFFTQKFCSGDYFFVYADGDNNVVGLMQPITYSVDTPEAYMSDEDVVDTMIDDIMDATEIKNGNICYYYYYRCAG